MVDRQVRLGRRAFLAIGVGAISGCVQSGAPGGRGTEQTTAVQSEPPPPTANNGSQRGGPRTETTAMNRPETGSSTTVGGDVTIGIDSEKSYPQATETINRASGRDQFDDKDTIFVWNKAATVRHISVTVEEKSISGEPLFRESYRFEPDAYVTLNVSKSGKYSITIGLDGKVLETVEFDVDDCNDQSLFVTVGPDGSVRSSGMGTAMGCMTVQSVSQG